MAIGGSNDPKDQALDEQGHGQSAGIPASGEVEGNSFSPMGNPGMKHWQSSFITRAGLEDRGNVFFAAVEMTRMPMLVTDPNGPDNPIVFVNRAFLDLSEYSEEQVIGRNCRFLQGKDTSAATVAEIRTALKEQRAVAVDILNYKASGKPFWNALFIGPIFDREGKLLYYFASQLDITRRRVSEQSYLQAQKMEAIGQLTAGLAHDFNNLLHVTSGNQEVALELIGGTNEAATRAIERAQSAIAKAARLTQQLLAFARKQRLEPKRVNLNALVIEFSEMLIRTLGEKVDLHLDLKPGIPACTLDPTHLEMALLNVLINARDAMPDGGKVTVGTSLVEDRERIEAHGLQPGKYVLISVVDEGVGMPPEVARRATEPFFTTKGPGTGLGLAMVHGFVQQSQGLLEIDSAPGKGTTIRMIFPMADRHALDIMADRIENNRAGHGPEWKVEAILERKTILLVDDSPDIRELSGSFLQSLGYRVISAASGEEALELLERYGHVDLLFSDVIMPGGMNGLQLMHEVRQRQPAIPVLLATGYMDDLTSVSGMRAGVADGDAPLNVLPKPFRLNDLAERVRAALHTEAPQRQARDFRHEG